MSKFPYFVVPYSLWRICTHYRALVKHDNLLGLLMHCRVMSMHNLLKSFYLPLVFKPPEFFTGLRILFGDQVNCWVGCMLSLARKMLPKIHRLLNPKPFAYWSFSHNPQNDSMTVFCARVWCVWWIAIRSLCTLPAKQHRLHVEKNVYWLRESGSLYSLVFMCTCSVLSGDVLPQEWFLCGQRIWSQAGDYGRCRSVHTIAWAHRLKRQKT